MLEGPLAQMAQLIPGLLLFPVLADLFGVGLAVSAMIGGMVFAPLLAAAAAVFAIAGVIPVTSPVIPVLTLALAVRFGTNFLLEAVGRGREGFSTKGTSAMQRNLLAGSVPPSCLVCSSWSILGRDFSRYSSGSIECYTASPQVGGKKTDPWEKHPSQSGRLLYL